MKGMSEGMIDDVTLSFGLCACGVVWEGDGGANIGLCVEPMSFIMGGIAIGISGRWNREPMLCG